MKKQYIKPSVEAYKVNKTSIICCSDAYIFSGNDGDEPSPSDGYNGIVGE